MNVSARRPRGLGPIATLAALPMAMPSAGCGAPAPAAPPSAAPIAASAEGSAADGGADPASGSFAPDRAGTFHSRRFELSFALPDGKSWRIDDHRSPWLVATHEPTRSRLVVRAWPETASSTDRRCYEKALSWDPSLPKLDATTPLVDEIRKLGGGVDARVVIAAAPSGGGPSFAVLAAAPTRKCIVLVYRTEELPTATEEDGLVLDRLAKIERVTLGSFALDDPFTVRRVQPASDPESGAK